MRIEMKNWIYGLSATFIGMGASLSAQEDLPPVDQGFWQTLVMLAIFITFFYIIMWRPEQKRRQVLEAQRNGLKKGDRVIAMGIIGTVSRFSEQGIVLKMIDGAKIEVLRGAITDIFSDETSGLEEKKIDATGKKVELVLDEKND
jgi:preprotein translocase subunit YajC